MSDINALPLWLDIHPRSYTKPTVVKFRTPQSQFGHKPSIRYAVVGTDYGYIHTAGGDLRTWSSYSGAYKAMKKYAPL